MGINCKKMVLINKYICDTIGINKSHRLRIQSPVLLQGKIP